MGHLVVARAAETAIELAREIGVAWVGCRMSGHAGAAGVYAALPLKADMIGMYSAVANANHMPLAGGAEPLLGTNPLAIAIPAGEEPPVVLDIATSIVSYGTIKNHRLAEHPAAARLDDRSEYRRAGARSAQECRGAAVADGRLQGRGACADDRTARRHAQRRAVRPRLRGLQRASPTRSPTPDNSSSRSTRAASVRSMSSRPRSIAISANCATRSRCPVIRPYVCRARQRAQRRADRLANGLALAPELRTQLDKLAADLGIKPLAQR